jgi:gamma-glutamyltranspeptidase/glutathione hydrolase
MSINLFVVSMLGGLTLAGMAHAAVDRPTQDKFSGRSEVLASNGMVASSHPLASQIGLDVLKNGGSAVDAAIAANAALGLMEPYACGIGGDLFAIVWDAKTRSLYGINASGRSPQSLTYEHLRDELQKSGKSSIPEYGVLPVTVPGAVDGWFQLHKRFGRLPMPDLLAPSIRYAEEGFPLTPVIVSEWREALQLIGDRPGDLARLFKPGGSLPSVGDLFRNPDLAKTYRLLATAGLEAFYQGEIASRIEKFLGEHGGYLKKEDFSQHQSDWIEPLSVNYRGYEVYQLPPNSQGLATLQMLNILEEFDLKSMKPGSAELLHLMVETKKLVYEDRARFYADMDFASIPVSQLLSKDYAVERSKLISGEAQDRVSAGNPALNRGDTTYISTADKEGNMVSLIQSVYYEFGSGLVAPGLGFTLQNRGRLFSLDPDHRNVYAAGKRPFHTIIPGFVTLDGKPYLSFGVMGGAIQPQGQVHVLSNIIDFGMNVQEAGDAPRWRHDGSSDPTGAADAFLQDGGSLMLETSNDADVAEALRLKGHRIVPSDYYYGGYQAIMRDENGTYRGASESRKDGQAVGY